MIFLGFVFAGFSYFGLLGSKCLHLSDDVGAHRTRAAEPAVEIGDSGQSLGIVEVFLLALQRQLFGISKQESPPSGEASDGARSTERSLGPRSVAADVGYQYDDRRLTTIMQWTRSSLVNTSKSLERPIIILSKAGKRPLPGLSQIAIVKVEERVLSKN